MKIQVNSDDTIAVDASLTRFVEGEVSRVLGRFAKKLARAEVHLSDVDNRKTGQADKRCLIEVRGSAAPQREREGYENGVRNRRGGGQDATFAHHLLRPEGKAGGGSLSACLGGREDGGQEDRPSHEKESRCEEGCA
jgi:hypothetical protein